MTTPMPTQKELAAVRAWLDDGGGDDDYVTPPYLALNALLEGFEHISDLFMDGQERMIRAWNETQEWIRPEELVSIGMVPEIGSLVINANDSSVPNEDAITKEDLIDSMAGKQIYYINREER